METVGLTGVGLVAGVGLILLVPAVRREFARVGRELADGARAVWAEAKEHAGLIAGVGTLAAVGAAATAAVTAEAPAAAATAGATTAAGAAITIPAAIEALEAADTVKNWVDDLVNKDDDERDRTKH